MEKNNKHRGWFILNISILVISLLSFSFSAISFFRKEGDGASLFSSCIGSIFEFKS